MKTPETLAEEWSTKRTKDAPSYYNKRLVEEWKLAKYSFLAGYEAAQKQFAPVRVTIPQENCEAALEAMKSTEQFIKQCVEWTSALTTPKWISVKERLPDINQWILADGPVIVRLIEPPSSNWKGAYAWETDHESFYDFKDVTHWMPLPAAPKDEA